MPFKKKGCNRLSARLQNILLMNHIKCCILSLVHSQIEHMTEEKQVCKRTEEKTMAKIHYLNKPLSCL